MAIRRNRVVEADKRRAEAAVWRNLSDTLADLDTHIRELTVAVKAHYKAKAPQKAARNRLKHGPPTRAQ